MKSIPVTADKHVLEQLESYAERQNPDFGLIIGQSTIKRNYVIHLAPTFKQSDCKNALNLSKDELEMIKEHAKYITRSLPGGLWVLGAYVISDRKTFTNSYISSVIQILRELDHGTKQQGFCNYGKFPSDSYLFFHKNYTTNNFTCSSVDKINALHPVDCDFLKTISPWYQINTDFNLNGTFLDRSWDIPFQKQIANFLSQVNEKVNGLNINLFGKEWEPSNYLEQILKDKSEGNVIDVTLYETPKKKGSSEVYIGDTSAQLEVVGSVRSRVSLHPRTTVEETATAIRQDIIRSLSTKFQLHWESLVGEENRAPEEGERVHELPRRILVNPKDWNAFLCEYLYPGEGVDQAVKTCQELFDLVINPENIVDNFEIQADVDTVLSEVDMNEGNSSALTKISTPYFAAIATILILCLALIINFYFV